MSAGQPTDRTGPVEGEEERLERRLREIMGDTDVGGMPDINLNGTNASAVGSRGMLAKNRRGMGPTTTSPIQESDMVKHYKSLFFARNGVGSQRKQDASRLSTNGYTEPAAADGDGDGRTRWTSKYKTNIVPPHMKRPKPHNRSTVSRKIQSSFMSSLPPEQIPSYFSAPALARMERKGHETEKKEGEPNAEGVAGDKGGLRRGMSDRVDSTEESAVTKAELEQAKLELEETKDRLQLYQDQSERVQQLESQIADLNETKLDAKGMSVSMQRQLTQLTGERQEMLLELRDLKQQVEEYKGVIQKKDEVMKVLKQKAKLLEVKGMKLERELAEVKSEIDAEREALSNTLQNQSLKDAMLRIAELEALNFAMRESIKQRDTRL